MAKNIILIPFVLLLAIAFILNTAYPASVLWGWFITPMGFGDIGLFQAAGIMTTISVFRLRVMPKRIEVSSESETKALISGFISPWILLLFGWLFI